MNCIVLEPLYRLAAQTLTPPDSRWLEAWPLLLGNVQLDLWLNGTETPIAHPMLALMHSLPTRAEERWLAQAAQDHAHLFTPNAPDVTRLPALRQVAAHYGYALPHANEPGLAAACAFMAYLCHVASQEPMAATTRRQLLGATLCPLLQVTASRLQQTATTPFYQAVGAFLPALVACDLAGDSVMVATSQHAQSPTLPPGVSAKAGKRKPASRQKKQASKNQDDMFDASAKEQNSC